MNIVLFFSIPRRATSERIQRIGLLAYPFTWALSNAGLIPRNMHGHAVGCINQKRLMDNRMATYGVFVAVK